MSPALCEAIGERRFVFVVGKGGVGKTTTAGALAVALADAGEAVHLISTDPAHSTGDLFGAAPDAEAIEPCGPGLRVEPFDAGTYADRWAARARPHLTEVIASGTWLDDADVDGVLDASLPGIDEVMAALRLAELATGERRVVVDTAPMGHTLRLLDAGGVIETWLAPLRAMADKAGVVASHMTGVPARLSAERFLDDVEDAVARYRRVLAEAAFLVVERAEPGVRMATDRLLAELADRSLHVAAVVRVGPGADRPTLPVVALPEIGSVRSGDPCAALLALARGEAVAAADREAAAGPAAPAHDGAREWFARSRLSLLLFAGKGGVGKSTCAAAVALGLAAERSVLLVSTDPAGSLAEALATPVGTEPTPVTAGLDALQIDAAAALDAMKARYRADIVDLFERVGLDQSAALDRAVMESLFDLAPPGIDELVGMIELTQVGGGQTVVLDAAPTGHFLRLLEMPELARRWTAALLRLLLRYGAAGSLDEVSERVVAFSKRLRELSSELTDRERSGAIVVTLDEPMVSAETVRLRDALAAAGVSVAAVVVNRASRARAEGWWERAHGVPVFAAPELRDPPAGIDELAGFMDRWERVV